jgi:hypothetical protein
MDTIIYTATGKVGNTGASNHGFGWRATDIDTGATDMGTFDQGDALTRFAQGGCDWPTTLSTANHDCIILFGAFGLMRLLLIAACVRVHGITPEKGIRSRRLYE